MKLAKFMLMNKNNLILSNIFLLIVVFISVSKINASELDSVNFFGREAEVAYFSVISESVSIDSQLNTQNLYSHSDIVNKLTDLAQVILNIEEYSNLTDIKIDNTKSLPNTITGLNSKYETEQNYAGAEILTDIELLLSKITSTKESPDEKKLSNLVDKLESQVINLLLEQEQKNPQFEF